MVWVKSRCSQSKCTDWSLLTSGVDMVDLLFALNIYSGPRSDAARREPRRGERDLRQGGNHTTTTASKLLLLFVLLFCYRERCSVVAF